MPINFHPKQGMVLMCDFGLECKGFAPPEIFKERPVLIISDRNKCSNGLCTVIPLSTKEPTPLRQFHLAIPREVMPVSLQKEQSWAKCDLITHVSFKRLNLIKTKRRMADSGKRGYERATFPPELVQEIINCINYHIKKIDN